MLREEIFQYVKNQYGTEPEYLWKDNLDAAVLRHHPSNKWYESTWRKTWAGCRLKGTPFTDGSFKSSITAGRYTADYLWCGDLPYLAGKSA